MASLTLEQLRDRLRFDYKVVMRMCGPLIGINAYRNHDDLAARKNPIEAEQEGHLATHYLADYRIKTLIGPGRYSDSTSVSFDLLAQRNYPFSEPACWVVSNPIPWSAHFKAGSPVCTGEIWKEGKGEILLAHLIVHVAKLLNFDEVARGGGYVGWNAEAIAFWKNHLKEQPITPGLAYPVLPVDITHPDAGTKRLDSVFSASRKNASGIKLGTFQPKSGAFQPKGKN